MTSILPAALVAAVFLYAPATRAETPAADGPALAGALAAAETRDWAAAEAALAPARDPLARDILRWLRLTEGAGSWSEYAGFLETHGDWPRLDTIRANAERAMPAGLPAAQVLRFFRDDRPLTGTGALRLAAALDASARRTEAADAIVAAWTLLNLTTAEEAEIAARHPKTVAKFAVQRLDHLIWRGELDAAEAMLAQVPSDQAALAQARIALRRDAKKIDGFVEAVPDALLADAGLAHDRFVWRMKKEMWQSAAELVIAQSAKDTLLGRPETWAKRRLALAHRLMRDGDPQTAYRVAATHRLKEGSDFEELEWFAGWLALRKLGDPKRALGHFQTFRSHVDTPISRGRAGYWLGRTWEALGDRAKAAASYREAAAFQTSFYGQLAAERSALAPDATLAGPRTGTDWRRAAFAARPLARVALLFHIAGAPPRVWQVLTHLAARETNPAELAAIAEMALDLGYPHIAVRVAKIAAAKGHVIVAPYYPLTDLAGYDAGVAPELRLAIARQESEFNTLAISPAGARGLMQLMPATAKKVSRTLGLDYSLGRLTSDWQYNAQLGQSYLSGLLDEFDSYVLAAAGYNAGPHRVTAWIEAYGDPRTARVDAIDWIETIPFAETRNYVMRVMEGMQVYRARLAGKPVPFRLSEDLRRRL